jgi:hypothetical protein
MLLLLINKVEEVTGQSSKSVIHAEDLLLAKDGQ